MQVRVSGALLHLEQTAPTPEPLTFDQPVGTLPIVDDARWSSSLTDNSFWALVIWIVLLIVLQAVTWPIVKRIFSQYPDRGWGFARLITIALAGFVVWFPAALELTRFRAIWCWVAVIAIGATCWFWTRRLPTVEDEKPRSQRSYIVATESVFWLAFAVFLLFRLINPDSYEPLWGGEKAMEFAHINSILRSAHFPPVDPWYAGGYLNYYYYGSYLVAFLIKLTGIPTEIAFNLSLPLFIALLASGMFSLGGAVARAFSRSRLVVLIAATAAAIFSVAIGNMVAAARTIERITDNSPQYLFDFWFWGPTRILPNFGITEFPLFAGLFGDLHAHVIALPFTVLIAAVTFSLIQDREIADSFELRIVVNTFLPRVLLLGLLLGTLFMTNAWDAPTFGILSGLGILAALIRNSHFGLRIAVASGFVAIIGLVAYISIIPFNRYYVALFSEIGRVSDKTPLLPIEAHFGGFLLIMTAGFALCGFREQRRGQALFDPMVVLPILGLILGIRWYAADRDAGLQDLSDTLTVVIVGVTWLAIATIGLNRDNDFAIPFPVAQAILALGGIVAIGGLVTGRPVFALYIVIGASAGVSWLIASDRPERFLYSLIAIGTLLGAALELVFLVDDLRTISAYRMNTVFKFYNQLWTLFAIASAGFVARMVAEVIDRPSTFGVPSEVSESPEQAAPAPTRPVYERIRLGWARAGLVLTVGVILLGLAYPVQAIGPRLDTRFPDANTGLTLNAFAWMNSASIDLSNGDELAYADDLAAIDWFNSEVPGNPVIAEASFGAYRCNGSRFSIATGLPDIIGWERHQQQQRDRTLLPERGVDLRELYETDDVATKLAIIEKYDVDYVIVGQTERVYPVIDRNGCVPQDLASGIAVLESMVGTQFEVAFSKGTTTVYRVLR